MKNLNLMSIKACRLNIVPHSAMAYTARILGLHIPYRKLSSIIYVVRGRYEYSWNGGRACVCPGDFLYIPKAACYDYEIEPGDRFVCQIEFDTFIDGEECVFSTHPIRFGGEPGIGDFMLSLTNGCGEYQMLSGLFRILGLMADELHSVGISPSLRRITPAIEFINSHYAEETSSEELAAICYLSPSQMRRLFASELGLSPSEYRTEVRIRMARRLLSGSYESIATVAAAVGYDSPFAFSKAFKKLTGMSPRECADTAHRKSEIS